MYPERRGQRDGRLDVRVTILDGIGLLFFIILGVIAFCVDFSNGTLYLPEHKISGSLSFNDFKQVRFDPKHTSLASIEKIIKNETGHEVKLEQDSVQVTKLASTNDMLVRFAKAEAVDNNERIALLEGDKNEYIR